MKTAKEVLKKIEEQEAKERNRLIELAEEHLDEVTGRMFSRGIICVSLNSGDDFKKAYALEEIQKLITESGFVLIENDYGLCFLEIAK